MKCPHCATSISPFSPLIMGRPNQPGGGRQCTRCGKDFIIGKDIKVAIVTAVIAATAGFFLLRPIPFVGPFLWGIVSFGAVFLAAARLKKL